MKKKRRDGKMEKTVDFNEKDKDLLKLIEAYQKDKGISFDAAVKELCKKALTQENGLEWGSFDK